MFLLEAVNWRLNFLGFFRSSIMQCCFTGIEDEKYWSKYGYNVELLDQTRCKSSQAMFDCLARIWMTLFWLWFICKNNLVIRGSCDKLSLELKLKILINWLMTNFKQSDKILRSQGANSLIWLGVAGSDRGRVDQFAAEDVWKGNQLTQIPCMCSPWDKHLSSSAVLLAALALIYCSSEWAAFVYYVMFSVWVEAEVPHHCSAKTLSTQIMFILGSSWDFTVVGQILY